MVAIIARRKAGTRKSAGELAMLLKLYDTGIISLPDAVKNSNMSEDEFLAFAKKETTNT